jgi:hypothetical protein
MMFLRHLLLLLSLVATNVISLIAQQPLAVNNHDHLVVISHGIMGTRDDLNYLAAQLEKNGCKVLKSVVNERLKSLRGLQTGGEDLALEIVDYIKAFPSLTRLSIVGNSLGGLYARYAMHILFNTSDGTMAGLKPHRLLTIATPHLGVRNHTFVEDMFGIHVPGLDIIKKIVSRTMFSTGRTVFSFDGDKGSKTLLYQMATEEKFLSPLRSFTSRRLYANLQKDFVVPLGTAAFLHTDAVDELRGTHSRQAGIVSIIRTGEAHRTRPTHGTHSDATCDVDETIPDLDHMIARLDSLGWEKVVVNFPRSILPLAHNKICALTRSPRWLYHNLLGFNEGQFVMENATSWIVE